MMTFRRLTLPNILECAYDPSKITIIVARICLAITGLFSIPVNHHPSREATWQINGGKSSDKMTKLSCYCNYCFFHISNGTCRFHK